MGREGSAIIRDYLSSAIYVRLYRAKATTPENLLQHVRDKRVTSSRCAAAGYYESVASLFEIAEMAETWRGGRKQQHGVVAGLGERLFNAINKGWR